MMEASHNAVLLHLVRALRDLLARNILRNIEVLNQRPGWLTGSVVIEQT